MEISSITTADLSGFIQSMNTANLQPATKKNYLSLVHKIFIYANEQQLIKSVPVFPRLKQPSKTKQGRDYLEIQEYKKLNRAIIKEAKIGTKIKGLAITLEMKLLVNFMINSFIRPSDLRVLKHQHISRQYDKKIDTHWLILNHPASKTNAHPVHTMPRAVAYYDQLLEFRTSAGIKPAPDDYVFYPQYLNRDTCMSNLGKAFKHAVNQSKLKQTTGKNITLYSLRHTAIMYRLIKGDIDTLHLAKNCRTSQQMIEDFYASKITTAQVRKKLHSFTK
jgi:integrase